MSSTHPSFDPEDNEILGKLVPEGAEPGSQAGDVPTDAPAPSPEPTPAPTPAPAADPAPTPEPTPAPAEPQGNVKAALRASRHQEKRLREQNAQLQAEIQALRDGKSTGESLELTTEEEQELQRDFPAQYKVYQKAKALEERFGQQQTSEPEGNEFQPRLAPPEVQVLIDEVPQLVAWQHDPDKQGQFDKAIEYDEALRHDPDWKAKPVVERFNEAARRAAAAFGAPTTAPSPAAPAAPRTDPAAVIAAAPAIGPKGISDFPGGAPGQAPARNFAAMSDEAILASLTPEP